MARMHSRKKGKSGSKKPAVKSGSSWIRYNQKEIELLVVKLSKEEKTPSQIGLFLRDVYGIPDIRAITGKSITSMLKDKNILSKIPEDLMALIKRSIKLRKHLETNKQDFSAKRGLELTESKIRRLVKYYKNSGKLDQSWKYDPEKIRLLVE